MMYICFVFKIRAMRKQVNLPFETKFKWYSFNEMKYGVNEVFRYVKNFRNNSFETVKMYVYIFDGKFIPNTFTPRFDSCKFRFESIKNANGDMTKVGFECKHNLEIL